MKEHWDTDIGQLAIHEAARCLQEEIDKHIIKQLIEYSNQLSMDNYNRAMEIVETKGKE